MTETPVPTCGERGAATVMAICFLSVLMLVGSACGLAIGLVADLRRAQSAADLAALAGAGAIGQGEDPCGRAAAVARANGAHVESCLTSGSSILVTVVVPGADWLGLHADLRGQARAGPGDMTGSG
ncbi:Rv3654c family TadE-like protein [Nocardioides sp.]|uniref:Rv3654c family TadE-like protein n=1 Tax=Nocardioides sp. TaxID=35761 RepID=UPI00356455E3